MSKIETAVSRFKGGFNCAQAILSTYGEGFNLDKDGCVKIATGFGGGMGGMGKTCGAVTGAFLVIGLKHGNTSASDAESKNTTYRLVKEFAKRFEAKNGSIQCSDLLHHDIGDPAGYATAKDQKLFATICPKMVADAAKILEEVLLA